MAYSQKKAANSAKRTSDSGLNSEDKENTSSSNSINTTRGSSLSNRSSIIKRSLPQGKTMTTHRNSGGNGKHNTHNNNNNNNNMEELIESKLSHKLAQLQAQGLIGPSLRGKKILDDKGQERLENLEKKVMVLAMTAAEQTINNCFPEDNEGDEEEEGVQQDGGAASGAGGSGSSGGAIKPSSASSKRKESYSSGLKVGMTPLTSAQAAKSYIKKAKKRQMEGQLKEALKLYMNGKLSTP